jgi:hypothetical protein
MYDASYSVFIQILKVMPKIVYLIANYSQGTTEFTLFPAEECGELYLEGNLQAEVPFSGYREFGMSGCPNFTNACNYE